MGEVTFFAKPHEVIKNTEYVRMGPTKTTSMPTGWFLITEKQGQALSSTRLIGVVLLLQQQAA